MAYNQGMERDQNFYPRNYLMCVKDVGVLFKQHLNSDVELIIVHIFHLINSVDYLLQPT